MNESAELRICRQVLERMKEFGCPVRNLVIDASGVGRSLGELLKILSGENDLPWRMVSYARGRGTRMKDTEPRMVTSTPTDLWMEFQKFIQTGQIRGLDSLTRQQLVTRLLHNKNGKVVLETKDEYRTRLSAISPKMGRSPDEADTAMLCLQAAILQFGFIPGQRRELPAGNINDFAWQKNYAFQVEQQAQHREGYGATRALLLPNFAGAIEEIPKDADSL